MIGTRINHRYRIDSELGQGGMGTVYRGFDTTLKRDVAIKIMNEHQLGSEGSDRLLREAQAIAQLSHPNIVAVHDAGEYQQTPFIVMEYIEGANLYNQPPADIEEIVAVTKQVCAALSHAHAHSIIHRDLKPENVILTSDGTAKLMDFGLARSIRSRLTSEGTIQGTVFYLAPEQAQGKSIDPRSDLYSLGVMLYELTTGDLPFTADDPLAVISQHIHAPVVPPRMKNSLIPPALEALILELMEKDPAERPSSAKEVLERLFAPEILDVTARPQEEISVLVRIVRGRLVGREQELRQARQAWGRAMGGHGQLLLVSGEPGVGKSRLMREIVTQAEVSGGQAYVGESQEEGSAPYAAFAQIIRRAIRAQKEIVLDLPNLVLAELISITPNLQVDFPDIPPNPPLEPESEQLRLFECVIRFFSAIYAEGPLLLVLEDIQWADSGTLSLMQFLARRCREYPVMLLGTYREVELDEALPFHQMLVDIERKNLGERLKLPRLDADQTRDMLAVIFNEEITPEFLNGIYTVTEGNPFFIEEVCKTLVESGQVYFDGKRWQRPPDMADVEIPQSVKIAVQSRVSKLSESAQVILLNAAMIGREFDFELLKMVTDEQEDDLIESLEAALKTHLIEELTEGSGDQFSFSHALIPTALRESTSGIRRMRLHRKVAQAMEELMPDAYQRLAYQWAEAGDLAKRLECMIKAAGQAKKIYANEEAIQLYSESLALLPEMDDRQFDLIKARAEVFKMIADRESQLADIERMLKISEEQGALNNQVKALHAQAELYLETDLQMALKPAERALRISKKLGDPRMEARSVHLIGRSYALNLDHNKALPYYKESIQIAGRAGLKHELVDYLSYLANSQFNLGMRSESMISAKEAAALSNEVDDKRIKLIGTINLGSAYMAAMEREAGLQVIQTALSLARELGDLERELNALNTLGIILTGLNRLEEAAEVYLEMINNFDIFHFFRPFNAVNNIEYVYKALGEYEKFYKLVIGLMEKATRAGNRFWIVRLTTFFANSSFLFGRYQEALKKLESVFTDVEKMGNQIYLVIYLMLLGLFSALVGDFDSAHSYLHSAQAQSMGLEESVVTTDVWNISAFVAFLEGEPSGLQVGIKQATKGITMYERIGHEITWEYFYILGKLYLACEYEDETLAAIEKALVIWEDDKILFDLITPEMLFSFASKVFRTNDRLEEADEYLRMAYERVIMVAGKIQDEELRLSYLENVKENREIFQEAKERGMDDGIAWVAI